MQQPHYYRKIFKIKAEHSPNVVLALEQQRLGLPVTHTEVVPGVLSYREYLKRRATWDKVRQCVGLDAEFWEGADVLLFPPEWLNRAEQLARTNQTSAYRRGKGMGVDPGEGISDTCITIVDEKGIIEEYPVKTPDTNIIVAAVAAKIRQYEVPHNRVVFDRGGGLAHADRMRANGYPEIRSVGFGEGVSIDPKRGLILFEEKKENREQRYAYKNRRAEMYWDLRMLLDPANNHAFGISEVYTELRRQLAPLPIWYDEEGRIMLPPKQRKSNERDTGKRVTINDLIGCSPDRADALVLAVHGMLHMPIVPRAGLV